MARIAKPQRIELRGGFADDSVLFVSANLRALLLTADGSTWTRYVPSGERGPLGADVWRPAGHAPTLAPPAAA